MKMKKSQTKKKKNINQKGNVLLVTNAVWITTPNVMRAAKKHNYWDNV